MIGPSCGRQHQDDDQRCDECGANMVIPNEAEETPGVSGTLVTSEGFVGRRRELTELQATLEDALSGRGRLVMLAGEPGIGKTRTARELTYRAEERGAQVLWGRCYEGEGTPPYWPWLQAIGSYIQRQEPEQLRAELGTSATEIAEIFPDVRNKLPNLDYAPALEPEEARFRLFASVTHLLQKASLSKPLMMVLDDLHWADRSSLLLLEFLAREIHSTPLLVLGAYREVPRRHPLSATLGSLIREENFQRVQLHGLSEQEVEQLIQEASADKPSLGMSETIQQRTSGNPLFVNEIIRMMSQDGFEPGQELTTRIPEGAKDAIGRRLSRLSEGCNQVLTTASVVGREFDFRLLARLSTHMAGDPLLEALEEALEAGVIEELGDSETYYFSHLLIQETIATELSAIRRQRLHAQIGEVLEDLYKGDLEIHAAELAYHFGRVSRGTGSEKLVHYSTLAGEQALAAYAYEEAVGYFQRALAATGSSSSIGSGPEMGAETAALLFSLGRAQVATLQNEEAVASLSRAFDYHVEAGDVAGAVAVAEFPLPPVSGREGLTQLTSRALTLVPADSHEAGRLLCTHGLSLYQETGDSQSAQAAFGQAADIAQLIGDRGLEMRTLAAATDVDWYHLNLQEVLEKGRRVVELASNVGDPSSEVRASFYLGLALDMVGNLEGMRRNAALMLTVAEKLRDRTWLANAFWINGVLSGREGNWKTARDFLDRGLEVDSQAPPLLFTRALLEYETGNFIEGATFLDTFLEVLGMTEPGPNGPHALASILIPLVCRFADLNELCKTAAASAEAVLSSTSATPLFTMHARTGLALLAALRSDGTAAREQYTALDSQRNIMQLHVSNDHILGLLARTMGEPQKAKGHFEDALIFCREAGFRTEWAWTCQDYAETLLQTNDPSG